RVGHVRRVVVADGLEPGFHARRWCVIGGPYDLLHALEFLGQTLDAKAIDVPLQVALMHLEQVGGDHLRLVADLARGHGYRRPGHRCRTRAEGTDAIWGGVGVALFHHDVIGRDADFGSDDLGIGRLVPLTLGFAAHAGNGRAGRVHTDFAAVEHG